MLGATRGGVSRRWAGWLAVEAAVVLVAVHRIGPALPGARIVLAAEPGAAKEAARDLRKALGSGDVAAVDRAVERMARAGGASSMKAVLDVLGKIPQEEDALYWSVIGGAASFIDRSALEALGKFIKEQVGKPVARDLLYGLAENPSPEAVEALRPVVLEGPEDLRILATTKAMKIHAPATVDLLIELLRKEEKARAAEPSALAWLASEGLTAMTGQEFGPASVNWEGWWKQNRDKPLRRSGRHQGAGDSTGTAVDSLRGDRVRRDGFFGVEKAPPEAVVVLTAVYTKKLQRDLNNDHMEQVLETMKVPHTVVRREDFPDYDLGKAGIVLINCAQFHEFCICPDCKPGGDKNDRLYKCTGCDKHIKFTARLKDTEVKKLVDFVRGGGFIFGEDWVVKEVIERAFPEYVVAGPKLKDDTVDVVPSRGMGTHAYLRGIFTPKPVDSAQVAAEEEEEEEEDVEVEEEELEGEEEEQAGEADEEAEAASEKAGSAVEEGADETPAGTGSAEAGKGTTVVLGPDGLPIGVAAVRVKHTWAIDDESFALKPLDPSKVVRLLASGKLQKKAEGNGLVALAFRPGAGSAAPSPGQPAPRGVPGVVVLVLSHFGKQDSREDEYTIQNLLLNVLIDANQARLKRAAPPRKKAGSKG